MKNSPKILITGGNGLVGGCLNRSLSKAFDVLVPTHAEFDLTDKKQMLALLQKTRPHVVVHAAAFRDNDAAEIERGNTDGTCFQVNVEGTKKLVSAAKQIGAFIIYISTGSVFSGSKDTPGPFTESDHPGDKDELSWYSWTKACGEQLIQEGAVMRLSHPVAMPPGNTEDYLQRALRLYDNNQLYPLFTDQYFPISFMDDVALAVGTVARDRKPGVYHVASSDMTTPYDLLSYVCKRTGRNLSTLDTVSFSSFIKTVKFPRRYSQYCAIDGQKSRLSLGLPTRTWMEIVDCIYR